MNKIAKIILAEQEYSLDNIFNNAFQNAKEQNESVSYLTPEKLDALTTKPHIIQPLMPLPELPESTNNTLIKLMPYFTYDNIVSALAHRARVNNERSRPELKDWITNIYINSMGKDNRNKKDDDEDDDILDGVSLDDELNVAQAVKSIKNEMNREQIEEIQQIQLKKEQYEQQYDKQLQVVENLKVRVRSQTQTADNIDDIDVNLIFKLRDAEKQLASIKVKIEDLEKMIEQLRKSLPYNQRFNPVELSDLHNSRKDIKKHLETLNAQRINIDKNDKVGKKELEKKINDMKNNLHNVQYQIQTMRFQLVQQLVEQMLDKKLFAQYSPYTMVKENFIKLCKGINKSSKSPQFQQVLHTLAKQHSKIMQTIINDLYNEYKDHPNFNLQETDTETISAPTSKNVQQHYQQIYNNQTGAVTYKPYENENLKKLYDEFFKPEFLDKKKRIHPLIIAYRKSKLPKQLLDMSFASMRAAINAFNKYISELRVRTKDYAQQVIKIDEAIPERIILSLNWMRDLNIYANMAKIDKDSTDKEQIKKQLSLLIKELDDNIQDLAYASDMNILPTKPEMATSIDVLKAYNYKRYKNMHGKIDPILIAWEQNFHVYDAYRTLAEDELAVEKKELNSNIKIEKIQEDLKNINRKLQTKLNSLPSPVSWDLDDCMNFFNQHNMSIDAASYQIRDIKRKIRQIQRQDIYHEIKKEYKTVYSDITDALNDIYDKRKSQVGLLHRIVNTFIRDVTKVGRELEQAINVNSAAAAWIYPRAKWNINLENIVRFLEGYIRKLEQGEYKNFNMVHLIKLLENCVYNCQTSKPYNLDVTTDDDMKYITNIDASWTVIEAELSLHDTIEKLDQNFEQEIK